jgi:hypothetical protein
MTGPDHAMNVCALTEDTGTLGLSVLSAPTHRFAWIRCPMDPKDLRRHVFLTLGTLTVDTHTMRCILVLTLDIATNTYSLALTCLDPAPAALLLVFNIHDFTPRAPDVSLGTLLAAFTLPLAQGDNSSRFANLVQTHSHVTIFNAIRSPGNLTHCTVRCMFRRVPAPPPPLPLAAPAPAAGVEEDRGLVIDLAAVSDAHSASDTDEPPRPVADHESIADAEEVPESDNTTRRWQFKRPQPSAESGESDTPEPPRKRLRREVNKQRITTLMD